MSEKKEKFTFRIRDKNQSPEEYLKSTNITLLESGNKYPESYDYPCRSCRRRFKGHPIGIPLSYRIVDGEFIVDCEDIVCSYNCSLRESRERRLNPRKINSLYINSEPILRRMFEMQYGPEEELNESLSWELHVDNGGPISTDLFYRGRKVYNPTPNLILNTAFTLSKISSVSEEEKKKKKK